MSFTTEWLRETFAVIVGGAILAVCGCHRTEAPTPHGSAAVVLDAGAGARQAAAALRKAATPPQAPAPGTRATSAKRKLAAHRKKTPIVVGGCGRRCRDYRTAFVNFIEALRARDAGRSAIPFLETSEMVYDGERLGDRWVQLWKDGRWAERRADIERFAARMAAWVDHVSDDALDAALASGVEYAEDEGPGHLVLFRHPPFEGDTSQPVWKFRVQARGREWLISEIDTNYTGE